MLTLSDFALAAAANSYGSVALSINANISYFRPPKGKILTAEAKEVSLSHKLASYNVDVWDEDQEVARFVGTTDRKKEQIKLD